MVLVGFVNVVCGAKIERCFFTCHGNFKSFFYWGHIDPGLFAWGPHLVGGRPELNNGCTRIPCMIHCTKP